MQFNAITTGFGSARDAGYKITGDLHIDEQVRDQHIAARGDYYAAINTLESVADALWDNMGEAFEASDGKVYAVARVWIGDSLAPYAWAEMTRI